MLSSLVGQPLVLAAFATSLALRCPGSMRATGVPSQLLRFHLRLARGSSHMLHPSIRQPCKKKLVASTPLGASSRLFVCQV